MSASFQTPILATLMVIVPFSVFVGASGTVTIDVVATPKDLRRKGLAGATVAICLLQLPSSLALARRGDWLRSKSGLPALAYRGLRETNRNFAGRIVEPGNVAAMAKSDGTGKLGSG